MAKSKSQERREKVMSEATQEKNDIVQCAEKIIGTEIKTNGAGGKDYTAIVRRELRKKGFDLVQVTTETGEQLQVIVVNGQARFQSIVVKDGEVTFDPSESVDSKTSYQVVARYELKKSAPAPQSEPENEE
jgi:hypothetical protein